RTTPAMEAGSRIMSGALKTWLAYWADAMESDGFVIWYEHSSEGGRFRIIPRDEATVLTLLYDDIDVSVLLNEASLRAKLMLMGLPLDVVDTKVQRAKGMATRFTEAVALSWPSKPIFR